MFISPSAPPDLIPQSALICCRLFSLTLSPVNHEDLLLQLLFFQLIHYTSLQYQQAFRENTQPEQARETGKLMEDRPPLPKSNPQCHA